MNLVALSDASPRAPQKCCSIVTGNTTVPSSPVSADSWTLLLFFHLPPLLLALPLSCSRSSPAALVEVEAATDGAEPHKQPLYYNYRKSVKTAQKGALWDTRALQRKYL